MTMTRQLLLSYHGLQGGGQELMAFGVLLLPGCQGPGVDGQVAGAGLLKLQPNTWSHHHSFSQH